MQYIKTTENLYENFATIMRKGNAISEPAIKEAFNGIIRMYAENHRHYHNIDHILEVHKIQHSLGFKFEDPDAINMAILLHDVIYTPNRHPTPETKSNEVASAEYAQNLLSNAGFDQKFIDRVSQLIRYTETHDCPAEDKDACLFIDLDMSIIGRGRGRYKEYATDIAREFLTVYDAAQYSAGRVQVLESFKQKENLFQTGTFSALFNSAAIQNMMWEIDSMQEVVTKALGLPPSAQQQTPRR